MSIPVPTWNNARRWATGKPQPGCWTLGWPKCSWSSGTSGMEKLEPSATNTRWPCQRAVVVDRGPDPVGDAAEQLPEQGQGQAAAGLAVGRGGEAAATDPDEMSDGGIAAKDLVEEQMDDGDGVEEAMAPGVLDLAAGVDDLGSVELLGRAFLSRRRMLTIR